MTYLVIAYAAGLLILGLYSLRIGRSLRQAGSSRRAPGESPRDGRDGESLIPRA